MSKEVKRWKRKQLDLMHPEHEVVDANDHDAAVAALLAERDALKKALDRQVPLHDAIQRAAGDLPEGWEIRLCVEHHAGWVELIGPDGSEDFATNNERLDYTVIDALEHALQGAQP
ncbi:hypothetical protein [Stutzerimonas stutzeri]|uniref:hypothetical protein n=1 Tax=Stutzerimonas stutzeri TaxID=316 RepID=UPI003721F609